MATKNGRMISAPTVSCDRICRGGYRRLSHDSVGKGCHKRVHFLFTADIVGLVQNVLLLGFGQVGVAVHSRGVLGKGHTKPNGNFVEIHVYFSFRLRANTVYSVVT